MLADWIGLRGIEAMKVETACGSGASALRLAIMAIGSGEMDCALVVGVEKMTESKSVETTAALATAADADDEIIHGLSFVGINALIMRRYLHTYGWKHTDFAPFSINAHANAVHNPYARLNDPIDEYAYQKARMIADPINLLDASPIGDGSAAVVLAARDILGEKLPSPAQKGRPLIRILASTSATDTIALHSRKDPIWLSGAEKSARQAYRQAGLGPSEIDFFELHDAFSIMAALSLEACGFAEAGKAPRLGLEGNITLRGQHSHRHTRRAKSPRPPSWCNWSLSGRRNRSAASRRGRCCTGGKCKNRNGSEYRRQRCNRHHPHPWERWVN